MFTKKEKKKKINFITPTYFYLGRRVVWGVHPLQSAPPVLLSVGKFQPIFNSKGLSHHSYSITTSQIKLITFQGKKKSFNFVIIFI